VGHFVDVTAAAGIDHRGHGMGCAAGDFDNDGDTDLYVTNWGADLLFSNDGDGTFTDVTARAAVATGGFSSSAVFFDYDRDGWLDLYVARYVRYDPDRVCTQEGGRRDYCGPTQFRGEHDVLYHNLGGGRFEDVSERAGITAVEDAGLGVVAADFDDDGWLDLYVANDADPNNLWLNQRDGTFRDDAVLLGAAYSSYGVAEAGMGVSATDADEDGDLDLFLTHLIEEKNTFYENRGSSGFIDASAQRGLASSSVPYTGFGTAFFDFDNDGDDDLAVVNGGVKRRAKVLAPASLGFFAPYAEPNLLFVNGGNGGYTDVSSAAGAFGAGFAIGRGLLPADLDNDGDLDLVVTAIAGPVRVYRNEGGEENNWLAIRAVDPRLRRDVVGARVTIETAQRRLVRHTISYGGYLTATPARIHLGLGNEERVERFVVRWPDGATEEFAGAGARQLVILRRGEGSAGIEESS
jgi:hypothetical protein